MMVLMGLKLCLLVATGGPGPASFTNAAPSCPLSFRPSLAHAHLVSLWVSLIHMHTRTPSFFPRTLRVWTKKTAQLVCRHRDTVSYWTAIPNAGPVLGWMRKGRVEILAMLKRAKYREVLRRDLLKRKLRGSKLGMPFHIADVVGLGLVTSIKTTSGDLYRFKADGD